MPRLIDADTLKAVFEEKSSVAVCGAKLCKAIISRIDESPTVDAEPVRHGRWIVREKQGTMEYSVICSQCGEEVITVSSHTKGFPNSAVTWCWCPNCGTKMDGKDNDKEK